jgi:dTDP-4-amino-4,6-dideoxygalactose transaminase
MDTRMTSIYDITAEFERRLCDYTGAPYAVAVDNQSNALFLALMYEGVKDKTLRIPSHTYPSVPCAIIHAGAKVEFYPSSKNLTGEYNLQGSNVWDSALRFTTGMYRKGTMQCLSFTGPYKHLKLGKAGAILTDNHAAYLWLKRARFSGRRECSYHDDSFDMLGWNFYLLPEIAAKGVRDIQQFYNLDGTPKDMPDITLPYPDLSTFPIYTK